MSASETNSYLHLFWGYGAIWLCIAAMVVATSFEQRKQRKELSALRSELAELRQKHGVSAA
ncbi:MAG: hypothetical protein U0136_01020 [Bdellovibrionota bacterium]